MFTGIIVLLFFNLFGFLILASISLYFLGNSSGSISFKFDAIKNKMPPDVKLHVDLIDAFESVSSEN